MSKYYVTRQVNADPYSAKSIVELRRDALILAGQNNKDAEQLADSNSFEHVEKQIAELSRPGVFMLGVFAVGFCDENRPTERLVGFADVHEWTRQDKVPYSTGPEKLFNGIYANTRMNSYDPIRFGVHELLVDTGSNCRQDVTRMLLDRALKIAEQHEMYLTASSSDLEVVTAVMKSGFMPTGESAKVDSDEKILYRRAECSKVCDSSDIVRHLSEQAKMLAC